MSNYTVVLLQNKCTHSELLNSVTFFEEQKVCNALCITCKNGTQNFPFCLLFSLDFAVVVLHCSTKFGLMLAHIFKFSEGFSLLWTDLQLLPYCPFLIRLDISVPLDEI